MKFRAILLLSICFVFIISFSNQKTVKLSIAIQDVYGPFETSKELNLPKK